MERDKNQRYSRLAPFPLRQQIELVVCALNFFSPMEYEKNLKVLGRPETPGRTEPLDGSDFVKFLDSTGKMPEARRYQARIAEMLGRLERVGFLNYVGQGRDIFLGKKYYFLKDLTTIERTSNLWLSEALGPQFIRNQFADFTVQITGSTSAGDVHAGTGLVIAAGWILTCAHVLNDMEVHDRQVIGGDEYQVVAVVPHSGVDVGLLRIEPSAPCLPGLAFRDPQLCESLFTLGYPRVPLARTAPLIMQSGEVTSPSVKLLHGSDVFLYSAIARPGNSGGPVVASNGHVVGIVTQELTSEDAQPLLPFHAGISASTIAAAVAELEPTISIPVEDYS